MNKTNELFTKRRKALRAANKFRIWQALVRDNSRPVADVARELNLHEFTVRRHLKELHTVKLERPRSGDLCDEADPLPVDMFMEQAAAQ